VVADLILFQVGMSHVVFGIHHELAQARGVKWNAPPTACTLTIFFES